MTRWSKKYINWFVHFCGFLGTLFIFHSFISMLVYILQSIVTNNGCKKSNIDGMFSLKKCKERKGKEGIEVRWIFFFFISNQIMKMILIFFFTHFFSLFLFHSSPLLLFLPTKYELIVPRLSLAWHISTAKQDKTNV